ncbi:MAG TPA: outer membrane beta-barrel protein, partial [Xanthobacteraceae bacterium]
MHLPQVFVVVAALSFSGAAMAGDSDHAAAENEFAASFQLRGGYDTNPEFSSGNGVGGSAFIGTNTALAAGTRDGNTTYGVAAEANSLHYANPLVTPTLGGKVILRGAIGDDDFKLSSTTTLADVSSYNLRSTDLIQSVKAEVKVDSLKLFVTAEGAHSSLNQTNAIFQDFLPSPQQYLRGTLVPGISIVRDKVEVGVSANLSIRRYLDEFDDFGYHRDNERVQPFVFARYEDKSITAFGSVSKLYGRWHDVDFSNVDRTLFDASLSWRAAPFTLDLVAARRASETTFPISPITIDTIYSAKASWSVDSKLKILASIGYADCEYLDSPFRSRTLTYGVGVTRDLGDDLTWGVDVMRAQGTLISGERADAFIVATSLT